MTLLSFMPIIIMFGLFAARVPVALSLLIAAAVYFGLINPILPKEVLIQNLVSPTESFPFLAIPFFTCAGVVFNYSGITSRLLKLALVLVGHFRGGMAQVNVMMSVLMSGVSGSSNADAAMSTKILVPEMEKLGYSKGFATALTAASAVITPIIPPGIVLIIYALVADVSVARLFFAGYLPGLLLCVCLVITVAIMARIRGYERSRDKRASIGEIARQAVDSSWALSLPFGILLGLRFGVFTPTEAGAISVLYAVIVGAFVYRELKWDHFPRILVESVAATAGVMLIICASSAFAGYLTWEGIPTQITQSIAGFIDNPLVFLLFVNVLLLVLGLFFEGASAMIILGPILVPMAINMGIDPVHFGIILTVNLVIGGITPPVGTMMFITLTIARARIQDYVREIWPFLIALLLGLGVITYWADFVLFLPNLLM